MSLASDVKQIDRHVKPDQHWRKPARTEREFQREVEALGLLGPASVRLFAVEGSDLLLERVHPGTALPEIPDEAAAIEIAHALLRLWVPVPAGCGLPTVAEECQPLYDDEAVALLPFELVAEARQRLEQLLAAEHESYVLHGDLHHGNLLRSDEHGWVAIDPHGLVGDRGYDVGPFLLNPWDGEPSALIGPRLDLLSELLGMPRDRLASWGLVRAVLAEAWIVQDTGRPDGRTLRVARALASRP